jgi:hypothetical protein
MRILEFNENLMRFYADDYKIQDFASLAEGLSGSQDARGAKIRL